MNWVQLYYSWCSHEVEGVTFKLLPEDAFPRVLMMDRDAPGSGKGKTSPGEPLSRKGRTLHTKVLS